MALVEEDLIKGKLTVFHNDLKSIKKKLPLLIIKGGSFEIQNFGDYNKLGIEIIQKPFELKELMNKIEFLCEKENLVAANLNIKIPFIDKTNKTKIIFDSIYKIINNNLNTLIAGEIGTGKRQIANTISMLREPNKKILEINFLDFKNNNFEQLLLKKISADQFLSSKFIKKSEISNTILFSDIETMPLDLQNLLSAALKNNKNPSFFTKNTKFIATTSKNLKQILSNNNFSSDLFYTLSMYKINTLPLRFRKEDIKFLIREIISEFNLIYKVDKEIYDDAIEILEEYVWPGNITQLKNFLERCHKLADDNLLINKSLIKSELDNEFKYANKNYLENWKQNFNDIIGANIRGFLTNNKIESGLYYKLLKEFEKPLIIETLKFTNNNKLLSSQLLGINRNTLRKKMKVLNIDK